MSKINPSNNQITTLARVLDNHRYIRNNFDISWGSLDKADMSEAQYRFLLAMSHKGDIDSIAKILNNLGINPPKKIIK